MSSLSANLNSLNAECKVTEQVRFLLLSRGYSLGTVTQYLSIIYRFQRWMESKGNKVENASCESVQEYLSSTPGTTQTKIGIFSHIPNVNAALHHLLRVLGRLDKTCNNDPVEEEIRAFCEHLEFTCGLSPATRVYRQRYAAEFISYLSERNGSSQIIITPHDVAAWMTVRVKGLKPGSANVVAGAIRSYLKYRYLCNDATPCPPSAVPTIPHWRLSSIPRHLDNVGLQKLLASFDQSATSRRDLAMALLMTKMGLRASEVAHLTLEDIDWRRATLTIRGLKSCRDRVLPLIHDVGNAIAAYLKSGRLPTSSRAIFVRHNTPKDALLTTELVRGAMRRAYARAGFPKEWTGTHLLRHTAATRMQQGGASLKEVADVLGHRSIDTTIIYTKINVPALRSVAFPWPEAQV
jgi:site-specific recombinase XerD